MSQLSPDPFQVKVALLPRLGTPKQNDKARRQPQSETSVRDGIMTRMVGVKAKPPLPLAALSRERNKQAWSVIGAGGQVKQTKVGSTSANVQCSIANVQYHSTLGIGRWTFHLHGVFAVREKPLDDLRRRRAGDERDGD